MLLRRMCLVLFLALISTGIYIKANYRPHRLSIKLSLNEAQALDEGSDSSASSGTDTYCDFKDPTLIIKPSSGAVVQQCPAGSICIDDHKNGTPHCAQPKAEWTSWYAAASESRDQPAVSTIDNIADVSRKKMSFVSSGYLIAYESGKSGYESTHLDEIFTTEVGNASHQSDKDVTCKWVEANHSYECTGHSSEKRENFMTYGTTSDVCDLLSVQDRYLFNCKHSSPTNTYSYDGGEFSISAPYQLAIGSGDDCYNYEYRAYTYCNTINDSRLVKIQLEGGSHCVGKQDAERPWLARDFMGHYNYSKILNAGVNLESCRLITTVTDSY